MPEFPVPFTHTVYSCDFMLLRTNSDYFPNSINRLVFVLKMLSVYCEVEISFLRVCYIMRVFHCVSGQSRCMTFRAPMHE